MPLTIPTLETERLQLIAPDEAHLEALMDFYGDAESMQHIRGGQTFDRSGTWYKLATQLGHWQLRGYGFWSVLEKETGTIIGNAGLLYPAGNPALEIGWGLRRAWWRRGFAAEFGPAILDYAFQTVGADRVMAHITATNTASLAVAHKLGMRLSTEDSTPETSILYAYRSVE